MASLISGLAKEIFQILKGSGRTLSLFDEHGNKVFEPESAQSFFAEPDKLMVTINADGADSSLNMYVSETSDIDSMKKMIDTMRVIATRYNFLFNIRKYGKELNPKDFAFRATPMVESMYGSAKTSYQNIGKSKLIVRHSARVNEETRGARSRRINSIFVETAEGERFKFPNVSLHGARAFAKHLDAGGDSRDSYSSFIFQECDKQNTVSGFRRHIRKLGEENQQIAELNSLLKNVVEESKNRIVKAKGNRFYNGIVEQISNAPNRIGPLKSEIAEQANALKSLLAIDEQSALFDSLDAVAAIILEMKQMDNINFEAESLVKTFVAEDNALLDDLVESLVGEFGLEEGVHFERGANGIEVLDESLLEQTAILTDGITGLTLQESAKDAFLTYAMQWTKARMSAAGADPLDIEKQLPAQAEQLATGFKQIVAGNLPLNIKNKDMPKFPNPIAGIMFKLDKVVAPGSGMQNDALSNYLSDISHKIEHGKQLAPNERFFATKVADLVDKQMLKDSAIMPEMNALEEWMDQVTEANPYDVLPMDTKVEQALHVIDAEQLAYMIGEIYGELDPDDGPLSRRVLEDAMAEYLREKLGDDNVDLARYEDMIAGELDQNIIPEFQDWGYEITTNEGLDETLFNEEQLSEELSDDEVLEMVKDAISRIDSRDYYGVVSGDDEYDDGMALLHAVGKLIAGDISTMVSNLDVDDIIKIAREAWTKDWSKPTTEGEIDEAGNYPDGYDERNNPHAQVDPNDEIGEHVKEYLIQAAHNPPAGSVLAKVDASWFDGENDNEVIDDLASDLLHEAGVDADRAFGEEYGSDYIRDYYTEFLQAAVKVIREKFQLGEAQLDERGEDMRGTNEMTYRQLALTIPGFVAKTEEKTVDAVFARMQEFYMDSRAMGPVMHQQADRIKADIAKALGLTEEGPSADMGDDFVSDISYNGDSNEDADYIARLRKLAGI